MLGSARVGKARFLYPRLKRIAKAGVLGWTMHEDGINTLLAVVTDDPSFTVGPMGCRFL